MSVSLALLAGALACVVWRAGLIDSLQAAFVVNVAKGEVPLQSPQTWVGLLLIVTISASAGFFVGRVGARRSFLILGLGFLATVMGIATASVDKQFSPVHQGATAAIRPKSLLGEKYIAMTVGDADKPALSSGTRLPDSATQVNVELDQLINVFDQPTRDQLRTLINELGTGVAGQGRTTNETFQSGRQDLDNLAQVTDVLQQRDAELRRIVNSLTRLTQTLASDQQRANYPDLLRHSDVVLTALKQEDADVKQGIERMNQLFGEFDQGLSGRQNDLRQIFADLPQTLADLDALSVNLGAKGHRALPLVKEGAPGLIGGDLIFGSQPDKNVFTKDVFTRVMPTQGCFTINGRKTDTNGNVQDSGQPVGQVCTGAGQAPLPLGQLEQIICAAVPAGTLPVCGATAGGAHGAAAPNSRTQAQPSVPDTLATREAEREILGYLLQ